MRYLKKSHLLEDVYTYNDFSHTGDNPGCDAKAAVTPDMEKAYFITEYNGHMFPTKAFDDEEHRKEHAMRHVRVLDSAASHADIGGTFGWCMFDYNTHKDLAAGTKSAIMASWICSATPSWRPASTPPARRIGRCLRSAAP